MDNNFGGNHMNRKQIEQEWEKLRSLSIKDRPQIDGHYPSDIVKRRELLLIAQVYLSNLINAKNKKNRSLEKLESKIYHKIISRYSSWNTYEKDPPKI